MHQHLQSRPDPGTNRTSDPRAWRRLLTEALGPVEIDHPPFTRFDAQLRRAPVGTVGLLSLDASPHVVRLSPELIADDQPKFLALCLQLGGLSQLRQQGRTAELHPGDLAVFCTDSPFALEFLNAGRTVMMTFPQALVELAPAELARVTALRFSGEQGLGRMMSPFFAELSRDMDQLSGSYGVRLTRCALDLTVTTLSEELHRREASGTAHSALGREIRRYILQHLPDESLTPASIAETHFISLRNLYTLFAAEGQTVSAWIRSQRLARILRDLSDPLYADRPVSWIAGRWGLHDAAHFSRLFKVEHGTTPAAYRRRHLEKVLTSAAA